MAEQPSYPQVPSNVWSGVRAILNRNPRMKLDDTTLGIQLNVQQAAARQYIAELKRLGLLTDEGAATELALKWRMDETYREATDEIMQASYPEQLVDLAPPGAADRAQVERWFMSKGLGQGTAKNKAATYMLMATVDPTDLAVPKPASGSATPPRPAGGTRGSDKRPEKAEKQSKSPRASNPTFDVMPLNVNVQIHISADASSDQIESIFSSMRKYLHGDASN